MTQASDTWFCAEGERGGRPVLIRGRQGLQQVISKVSHPKLLRISWEFETRDNSGLPPADLNAKMTRFEELVTSALEEDRLSVFFCVFTHNGLREWAAYASDVQATCDKINEALAQEEKYPVQLAVEDDPGWQEYQSLIRDTGLE